MELSRVLVPSNQKNGVTIQLKLSSDSLIRSLACQFNIILVSSPRVNLQCVIILAISNSCSGSIYRGQIRFDQPTATYR